MYVADERKWYQKTNVAFDLAFTLGDLGERANSARCEVIDPGARLGCGEKNRIAGLPFKRWLGLGLMQKSRKGTPARWVCKNDTAAPAAPVDGSPRQFACGDPTITRDAVAPTARRASSMAFPSAA